MVKKLFALASVSALAGLVSAVGAAGCTETVETVSSSDAGSTTDAGKKDGSTAKPPADGGDEEEPKSCLDPKPVDATRAPYKTAKQTLGACKESDLVALAKAIEGNNELTWEGLKDAVTAESEECAKCVFSTETDENWGPIIFLKSGDEAFLNKGACFELAAAGADSAEACGKSVQNVELCTNVACSKCESSEDRQSCGEEALGEGGPCVEELEAVTAASGCGSKVSAYAKACGAVNKRPSGDPIKYAPSPDSTLCAATC